MSLEAVSIVMNNFKRGGSEKLAMIVLADWCNWDGIVSFSIPSLSEKICLDDQSTAVIINALGEGGYLFRADAPHDDYPADCIHLGINFKILQTKQAPLVRRGAL